MKELFSFNPICSSFNMKELFREKSISIHFDSENKWILAQWEGYQTVDSIKHGCEKILKYLIDYKVNKVLYDNTFVIGIWSGASAWVGGDWFPRMAKAGLKYFAWVYSTSTLSRLSTDEALRYLNNICITKTFDEKSSAINWLKSNL